MKSEKPRRFLSMTMTVFIIFSTFAVMSFTSMNVSAAFDETHYWFGDQYITADDTFPHSGNNSAQIIIEDGDLYICDGVTWTFNDNVSFEMKISGKFVLIWVFRKLGLFCRRL